MNSPDLVFLDEPMSGLDPIGRRLVREIILDLRAQGHTVFFSTHILSDAETLCDRVALLRAGRLVAVGRLDEILDLDVAHMEVLVSGLDDAAVAGPARRHPGSAASWASAGRSRSREKGLGALVRAVEEAGGRILSVQPVRQSLEDYFFKEMAADAGRRGRGRTESAAGGGQQHLPRDGARARALQPRVLRDPHDVVRPPPRPALDPAGREDHQGPRAGGHGRLRHADRDLRGRGSREQGDRQALALPAPGQAGHPRRVPPRQVRGPHLHAGRQRRGDGGRPLPHASRHRPPRGPGPAQGRLHHPPRPGHHGGPGPDVLRLHVGGPGHGLHGEPGGGRPVLGRAPAPAGGRAGRAPVAGQGPLLRAAELPPAGPQGPRGLRRPRRPCGPWLALTAYAAVYVAVVLGIALAAFRSRELS